MFGQLLFLFSTLKQKKQNSKRCLVVLCLFCWAHTTLLPKYLKVLVAITKTYLYNNQQIRYHEII